MNSVWLRNGLGIFLLLLLGYSLFQASWIAPDPKGALKLVAAKPADVPRGPGGCTTFPRLGWGQTPVGLSTRMMQTAVGYGAQAVAIDSEMADGQAVLPRYFTGKCTRDDNAPRSPLGEAMLAMSKPDQFISLDSAEHAKAALASAPAEGPERIFYGAEDADIAALKDEESFSIEAARQCVSDYRLSGLWGSVPESCAGGTALLTYDDLGLSLWGWPNRFLARMQDADVRVILVHSIEEGELKGLTALDQYNDIPRSYRGYLWVDNIEELGPALIR